MPESETPAAHPRVRYVFHVAADVAAMRRFYVEVLGLKEAGFADKPGFGWLSVDAGGFEMMWFRAEKPAPVITEFTQQPGWDGATREGTSWAVHVAEEAFPEAFRRLREAGVPLFKPVPEWRHGSYWGLSALDPMGTTVEVYATPKDPPANTTWPAA